MPAFSSFSDILPDPTNKIGLAGQVLETGYAGPGFVEVKLSSEEPILRTTSYARREFGDIAYHHKWTIDIQYNKLTCSEFYVLNAFLSYRRNTLQPFYVSIPPYNTQSGTAKATAENLVRGDETVLISGTGVVVGSIFSFGNSSKIYKVTRVETNSEYNTQDTQPGASQERLHVTPALQRDTPITTSLLFNSPKFLVIQPDGLLEYTIDESNLYSISLRLEEVMNA